MSEQSNYLGRLRTSLTKSKALSWVREDTRQKYKREAKTVETDPMFKITFDELKRICRDKSVTNKYQLVKKSMLTTERQEMMSFEVPTLGHLIYLFEDGNLIKFWFIPYEYLESPVMRNAVKMLHKAIAEFRPMAALIMYISKLQLVADAIDAHKLTTLRVEEA